MPFTVVDHPLITHKLTLLRESSCETSKFRRLTRELASLIAYEATKDFELEKITITGWTGAKITGQQIKGKKVTLVPILRAGLGMLDGCLDLLPNAKISIVGLYRNETTLEPVSYFEKLVNNLTDRTALILDPMLATGGSIAATVALLQKQGCRKIKVLVLVASPEGVQFLQKRYPEVAVFAAAEDSHLDQNSYIIPGLGDAGDKIFGTKAND